MGKKLTIYDVKKYIEEHDVNHECELLSNSYVNSRTPLLLKCNLCGSEYQRTLDGLKKNRFCCRNCSSKKDGKNKALGIEKIRQYIKDNNITGSTLLSEEYVNNRANLEFKCNKCGKHFFQNWTTFKNSTYHTCRSCAHKVKGFQKGYTEDDVKEIIGKEGYTLLAPYVDTHTPVLCQCSKGHKFLLRFSSYLSDGRRCRQCFVDYYQGKNVYQWKGGITEISHKLRSATTEEWKEKILKEADYKCDITGKTENLQVHHLDKNFSDILEQAFINTGIERKKQIKDYTEPEIRELCKEVKKLHKNVRGVVLSKDLHILFHRKYGYINNTEEQYLEFKDIYNNSF